MKYSFFYKKINELKEKGNLRTLKEYSNYKFLNLSSNDYLGISKNKKLQYSFIENFNDDSIFSSVSSRLLDGNNKYYSLLENTISELYKKECLIFNSGYHLNIGILPALTTKKDLIIADKFVHSSLIDGFKISDAKIFRYKHLNYEMLDNYLKNNRASYDNVFIVSESVFSMDGDTVDLEKIIEIKEKYNCFLYIDEAHSVGVFGEKGLGICEKNNLIEKIDFIVGTFGKAYCSIGAFLICNKIIKDFLINKSRSLIYTTALPPINLAWTNFIFKEVCKMNDKRIYLEKISCEIKKILKKLNYKIMGNSHIIPIIINGNENCTNFSEELKKRNILALPIKSPTVLEGTERIRISLNSNISQSDLDYLELTFKNIHL